GGRLMSTAQKDDVFDIFGKKWKNVGNLDYVACWYKKATDYIQGTNIRCALVSTNSISQGEQVSALWTPLFESGVHIDFAYRTFRWDSEASLKAHVHCVIVGFSVAPNNKPKYIYQGDQKKEVKNINGYLINASNVGVESRNKPLCEVPEMVFGNMPNDGGLLSNYSTKEKEELVSKYPTALPLFKKILGAEEFINNKERWCLWLVGVSPSLIRNIPFIIEKVNAVRDLRSASNRESTKRLADTPTLFGEIRQPDCSYLLVPSTSSERRRYVPIGFIDKNVISSNANLIIPNATLYHLGILTSNVHNGWMRAVCGRLKSDYRYSAKIVYNNFPWPNPSEEQKAKIEQTAQAILDARAKYPDCSLADLYDEVAMPVELRRAHQDNDRAVMEAYGFPVSRDFTESDCVAELFKMYQILTGDN
ncbi:MAG: methylase, partial [Prevotella sp.]|nr:methylase [Prevotella sp.]